MSTGILKHMQNKEKLRLLALIFVLIPLDARSATLSCGSSVEKTANQVLSSLAHPELVNPLDRDSCAYSEYQTEGAKDEDSAFARVLGNIPVSMTSESGSCLNDADNSEGKEKIGLVELDFRKAY